MVSKQSSLETKKKKAISYTQYHHLMAGENDNKQQMLSSPYSRIPQPWEKNPYHPLYLHHSALILISLEEDNYQAWQEAIIDALDVKNKAGFLDGTQKKPDEDGEELQQWRRCNTMVKHRLLGSMSKEMHQSVSRLEDAKVIWDDLKERFTQTSCLSVFKVKEASRDASDDNRLLDMMSRPSANFVGHATHVDHMSSMVCALLRESIDVPWIIDSGATDHIVHDPRFFTMSQLVENKMIRLPNGVTLPVMHVGTVRFANNFRLQNVMCP